MVTLTIICHKDKGSSSTHPYPSKKAAKEGLWSLLGGTLEYGHGAQKTHAFDIFQSIQANGEELIDLENKTLKKGWMK